MATTDIHTCPYCELRFTYANDVNDHIIHDHPAHAAGFINVEVREMPR